jgi:hypothetical protein
VSNAIESVIAMLRNVCHNITAPWSAPKPTLFLPYPILLLQKPLTEFKYDPKQSAQSRVRMLSMLSDKKIPLLAYHFPWPGIGHVSKHGDGFRFYPEGMKMEL